MRSQSTARHVSAQPDRGVGPDHKPLDRRRPCLVYLAAPLPAYRTASYDDALQRLRRIYPAPKHGIISARDTFLSSADWRERYPALLWRVDALYLLLVDGQAGDGCRAEWWYLHRLGRPTYAFDSRGEILPITGFEPSGNPDPSASWHVVTPDGKRII